MENFSDFMLWLLGLILCLVLIYIGVSVKDKGVRRIAIWTLIFIGLLATVLGIINDYQ